MRVFVCEFVTGGGFQGRSVPAGLRHEGDLMLAALVKDLAGLRNVRVIVARDGRLTDPGLSAEVAWLGADDDPWSFWESLADLADAVWPIAPETGGALERLSSLALDRSGTLLGSRPDAVRLAASKLASFRRLAQHGIAAVPTWPADPLPSGIAGGRWVLKPDDGAGCEETFLLDRPDDSLQRVPQGELQRFVLQPYIEGTASSLSLLCRGGEAVLLSCNRQHVTCRGGVFAYTGGLVGGLEARRPAFEPVAAGIAQAMPGLWGYVGVDLIDGPDGPVVVEVNPRLTTSYAGLRDAIGDNPASLVTGLLAGQAMPRLAGTVRPVAVEVAEHHG